MSEVGPASRAFERSGPPGRGALNGARLKTSLAFFLGLVALAPLLNVAEDAVDSRGRLFFAAFPLAWFVVWVSANESRRLRVAVRRFAAVPAYWTVCVLAYTAGALWLGHGAPAVIGTSLIGAMAAYQWYEWLRPHPVVTW